MRHTDTSGKRDALIAIMNANYEQVRNIEIAHGLRVGDTDFRPRIEYFHDAVRVLTHSPQDMYLPQTRLSVEHLSYDMRCLRYVQDRPLAKLSHDSVAGDITPPPSAVLLAPPPDSVREPVGEQKPVSPHVKAELIEHYRSYTVMYAALFAEAADINFKTRSNENDTTVEDLARIGHVLLKLEQGQCGIEQTEEVINQLDDVGLKAQLMHMLQKKGMKRTEKYATLRMMIEQQMHGLDVQTKSMDASHMNFLSGQMLMYQEAKDLVRKLSAQGMAMAGQFLESALSQGAGRGGRER